MSQCGPSCDSLCHSDTLVKWLAHYGNVPVCWAGPHYETPRPLATHIREDEDGFTPACEAHRRLTALKEYPMTNEDQLRVIRERLAAITPRHITANPMQWQQDGNWLLQLVTEQQREIEDAVKLLRGWRSVEWTPFKGSLTGLQDDTADFLRSHGYPLSRVTKAEQKLIDASTEAKGYRKQERPM